MNIWNWVFEAQRELNKAGHSRLVYLMESIPTWACNGAHEQVDAVFDEAVALARQQNNPWIEIFIRHWNLQSQVLHRHRGKHNLSEAVSLLDYTSRPDTRNCPQSICVVQDLANCYGTTDGAGYAQERIDVSLETLARINAKWVCYQCIGLEYLDALADSGRFDEEKAYLAEAKQELKKAQSWDSAGQLVLVESRIALREGDFEKAEKLARSARIGSLGESFKTRRDIAIAMALAAQGNLKSAIQTLPDISRLRAEPSDYRRWCEVAMRLVAADANYNDTVLRAGFRELADTLETNGCVRDALIIHAWRFDLGFQAEEAFACAQALPRMEALIPQLAKDLGASDLVSGRRDRLAQITTPTVAARDELLDADLNETDSALLEKLHAYVQTEPDDREIHRRYANSLMMNGYGAAAVEAHLKLLNADPADGQAWQQAGWAMLTIGDLDAFDALLTAQPTEDLEPNLASSIDWVVAHRFLDSEPERSLERLTAMLARNPNDEFVLANAAEIARSAGQLELALAWLDRRLDVSEEKGDAHWDRIVVATMLERWDLVRSSCKELGIDIEEGEGPVETDWGYTRIRVADPDGGEDLILWATRTGPVTAVIEQLRTPDQEQYCGRRVIFDPAPLNQLDQTDDEGRSCDAEGYYSYLYRALSVDAEPRFKVFFVDGVYPGDALWNELGERLVTLNARIETRTDDDYKLHDSNQDDTELRGVYAFVAVPEHADLSAVGDILNDIAARAEHPMTWPILLEWQQDEAGLLKQQAIEQRYGL